MTGTMNRQDFLIMFILKSLSAQQFRHFKGQAASNESNQSEVWLRYCRKLQGGIFQISQWGNCCTTAALALCPGANALNMHTNYHCSSCVMALEYLYKERTERQFLVIPNLSLVALRLEDLLWCLYCSYEFMQLYEIVYSRETCYHFIPKNTLGFALTRKSLFSEPRSISYCELICIVWWEFRDLNVLTYHRFQRSMRADEPPQAIATLLWNLLKPLLELTLWLYS